jgi:hypothetical protein
MAATIDEISIDYEEDGVLVVKQLDREVLTRGAWTTILFRYQQWEPKKEEYSPEKYTLRRYRKIRDEYRQQSKFNISSVDQAQKIIAALQKWISTTEQ